ncbi:RnfABCDGE type electron transport complex subunit D [Streptomyces kaniharaensis]|uniref:RnfABCDGE type electron transport complex subunit D n=1 Tax=Streptomyces kaniharaensis TaxID=212423 RepID=A0A6N7KHI1_9ACTN|nr:RnfABCDGE type electron transport complex subunit D [Streptomyces kaniharaensis]
MALRRFAISITVFNILGYTVLGFEQPWTWPLIALATAYTTETALELVGAKVEGRRPRFLGNGLPGMLEFLYPSHITGLALNMLTYVNDRLPVMMFGVVFAVSAKWVLRVPVRGRLRHYMNPSNFGIAAILVLFPWASIAPPYHFTEHVNTPFGWLIVLGILMSGTILNAKLTGRMWLIAGWLGTFALQAVLRGLVFGTSIPAALGMMTGVAFVLFTNYMITDPGTTPSKPANQVAFGAGVALLYALFMIAHIAYGIFFATALTCLIRGLYLWYVHFRDRGHDERQATVLRAAAASAPAAEASGKVAAV